MNRSLHLVETLLDFWSEHPAAAEAFATYKNFLGHLDQSKIFAGMSEVIERIQSKIRQLEAKKKQVILKPRKKQKILRLLEPEIDMKYDSFQFNSRI